MTDERGLIGPKHKHESLPVTASLVKRLPKSDLHSHIDGSVPAEELFAIAKNHGRKVTSSSGRVLRSPGDLANHVRGSGFHHMLEDIVSRFYPIVGLMQTEQILRDVGLAYVKELKDHNVAYAEGRFAPQYHTREGLTHRQAILSVAEGLEEGSERYGVQTNLIVAIGREASPETGNDVARAAVGSGKVVALDLSGAEELIPLEKFSEAFRIGTKAGLKRTVHAGEGAGSLVQNLTNIRTAIEVLGAQRVGHAIDISKDPALVRVALERRVALEMNPVSNLVLYKIRDFRELGIDGLLASGVWVTLNSDDPALWPRGSIDDVLARVCRSYGFGLSELDTLITNSFKCSFASERVKEGLLEDYARARRRAA